MDNTIINKYYSDFSSASNDLYEKVESIVQGAGSGKKASTKCFPSGKEKELVDMFLQTASLKYRFVSQLVDDLKDVFVSCWNSGLIPVDINPDDLDEVIAQSFNEYVHSDDINILCNIDTAGDKIVIYISLPNLPGHGFDNMEDLETSGRIPDSLMFFLKSLLDNSFRPITVRCREGMHLMKKNGYKKVYKKNLIWKQCDAQEVLHCDMKEIKEYHDLFMEALHDIQGPIDLYNSTFGCLGFYIRNTYAYTKQARGLIHFGPATDNFVVNIPSDDMPAPQDLLAECNKIADEFAHMEKDVRACLGPRDEERHRELLCHIDRNFLHLLRTLDIWKMSLAKQIAPLIYKGFTCEEGPDEEAIANALEPYPVFEVIKKNDTEIVCRIMADDIVSKKMIEMLQDFLEDGMTRAVFTLTFMLKKPGGCIEDMVILLDTSYSEDEDDTIDKALALKFTVFQDAQEIMHRAHDYNKAVATLNAFDPFDEGGYIPKIICHRSEDASLYSDEEYRTVLTLPRRLEVEEEKDERLDVYYAKMQRSIDMLRECCDKMRSDTENNSYRAEYRDMLIRTMYHRYACYRKYAEWLLDVFCDVWNMYTGRRFESERLSLWQMDHLTSALQLRMERILEVQGYTQKAFIPFVFKPVILPDLSGVCICLHCNFKHTNELGSYEEVYQACSPFTPWTTDQVMQETDAQVIYSMADERRMIDEDGHALCISKADFKIVEMPSEEDIMTIYTVLEQKFEKCIKHVKTIDRQLQDLQKKEDLGHDLIVSMPLLSEDSDITDIDLNVTLYNCSEHPKACDKLDDVLEKLYVTGFECQDLMAVLNQMNLSMEDRPYFCKICMSIDRPDDDTVEYRFYTK